METYIYSHMHVAEKTVIFGDVDSGLPASMFTSSLKKNAYFGYETSFILFYA